MNNTSFSDDRFSDQSVRTSRNCERNLKNTANLHRNQRFFHEKPNKPKNSNLTEQNSRNQQKTSPHRTKPQTNSGKREITEQNLDDQRTVVAPAHNHAENYKNLQELTLWMGTGFTRPHGGRLMIVPVDQNVEACLVKLGSTCTPRQPPSFVSSRSTSRICKRTERRRCGRSHSNAQVSDRTTKY